jgi:O-glycosyl hydrolase
MLPNGKKANLVVNTGEKQKVKIQTVAEEIVFEMPAQSASTIVW